MTGSNMAHSGRDTRAIALLLGSTALIGAAAFPQESIAQSIWNGSDSAYGTAGNWTPNSVPTGGDAGVLDDTGAAQPTVDLGGSVFSPSAITIDGTTSYVIQNGTLVLSTGLTNNSAAAQTISAILDGAGSVVQSGSGTLTVTGANAYTGGTTISGGQLTVGNATALGITAGGTTVTGGTLDLGGFTVIQNGGLILQGGTVRDGTYNSSGTFDLQSGTISASLSGSGPVTKTTSGTVILSGSNSYTGGTTISDGVLSIGSDGNLGVGGVTLSSGTLQATGTFSTARAITTSSAASAIDVSGANTLTLAGVVSGGGALTKTGTGTLTLSGSNIYTGTTTIDGGTLAIMATGSITSDVINAATFENAGTVTGGVTNDAGATFTQTGGSVSGGLTNSGTVNANGGALDGAIVNTGSGTVSVGGAVTSNGTFHNAGGSTLIVTATGSYTLAGLLTNDGAVTVEAGGLLTPAAGITNGAAGVITNDGTIDGAVTKTAGTTTNTGTITGLVTVVGGLFTGTGTAGGLTVDSGATFQPGSGVAGTGATISGDLLFQAGATYVVSLSSAAASLVTVNGGVTLNGGTVQLLNGSGRYALGKRYAIVTAAGGVSGQFDGLTQSSSLATPFLAFGLSYDGNDVYLDVNRSAVTFASVGQTRNQIATGGGLDSVPLTSPLIGALVQLDAASARQTYDQLSGEVYASAKTALIEDSRFVRDAALDRLHSGGCGIAAGTTPRTADRAENGRPGTRCDGGAIMTWGRAFGSWGHIANDGNAARLGRSTGGFLLGADGQLRDGWRIGILGGYSRTSFTVKDRTSSGTSDNYTLGLYAGGQRGKLAFRAGAAYTRHDISTRRSVAFTGFSDSLRGKYEAGTAQIFAELGYEVKAGGLIFEPFANLAHVNLHTDGFAERGGAAALKSKRDDTDTSFTTLGLRGSAEFDLGGASATATGSLGWRHAFGDVTPKAVLVFASGGAFTVAGVPIARNATVIDAGLDFAIAPGATLGASYSGQLGSGVTNNGVRANVRVKF